MICIASHNIIAVLSSGGVGFVEGILLATVLKPKLRPSFHPHTKLSQRKILTSFPCWGLWRCHSSPLLSELSITSLSKKIGPEMSENLTLVIELSVTQVVVLAVVGSGLDTS